MTTKALALLLFAAAALSACNTVAGAGQDVSAAGDAMTDTAGEVQQDM